MLDELEFKAEIDFLKINHIIRKVYQLVEENNKSKNESSKIFDFEDKDLGKISFTIIGNEIKISFSSIKKEFLILRHYMNLLNEKKKENKILIFTKTGLENSFKTFKGRFYFLVIMKQ